MNSKQNQVAGEGGRSDASPTRYVGTSWSPSTDLAALSAAYAFGIAKNHPFVDRSKPAALVSTHTFLAMNGFELEAPEPEAVTMILGIADSSVSEDDPLIPSWADAHNSVPCFPRHSVSQPASNVQSFRSGSLCEPCSSESAKRTKPVPTCCPMLVHDGHSGGGTSSPP